MSDPTSNQRDLRGLFSPVFIASAAVLLLAIVGLEAGLHGAINRFAKQPIALRKTLHLFDSRLPSFRPTQGAEFFNTAVSKAVGTTEVARICFDEVGGTGAMELQTLLFVTYYSDSRDTVPHTPDVCYRQGGATVNDIRIEPLAIPALGDAAEGVTAQILELEQNDWHQVLVYLFYSNGRFYTDRLSLRFAMNLPGDRHVYFSKIEVLTSVPRDTDPAVALDRARRLAAEAIPVLIRDHYPTREQVAGDDAPA